MGNLKIAAKMRRKVSAFFQIKLVLILATQCLLRKIPDTMEQKVTFLYHHT